LGCREEDEPKHVFISSSDVETRCTFYSYYNDTMTQSAANQSVPKPLQGMAMPVAWGLLLLYLVIFFLVDEFHWGVGVWLLVPDELLSQWGGRDWSRVALWDRLPLLLSVSLMLVSAWGWGDILLRPLRLLPELTPAEGKLFSLAVGFSFLSLCTLALGWAGLLQAGSLFVLLLAVSLPGMVILQRFTATESHSLKLQSRETSNPFARWLWLLIPLGFIVLWGGMLPPQHFDVREYHLQVPKEWFLNGRIDYLPHNVYGNMPLGSEVLSIPPMAIWPGENDWWWGALVGKTILAVFGLLTAWALYLAGRRWFSDTVAVVAPILFLGTPWILHVCFNGLIEIAVGFYTLMAVYAVLLWRQHSERLAWVGLTGFLAGSAVACKYPAMLFVVVPLLAYLALQASRRRGIVMAVFLVAVFLGCGLWFAKNLVLTGNPTYPLFGSWFGDGAVTVARQEYWQQAHQVPRDPAGHRYSLSQLWGSLSHFAGGSPWQSPLLIPLAVIGLGGVRRRREALWIAALVAYTLLAWWLVTHRIERFWVPVLPLLALLAGLGTERLCSGRLAAVLPAVLLSATLFGLLAGSSPLLGDNRFLVGLEQLRDGPAVAGEFEDTYHAQVHLDLNEQVSAGGKVLLVGDAEPFDLRVPTLYNTCFDESVFEKLMRDRNARQRWETLREHHVTHVFIYWSLIDRYREPGNYGFTDYVTRDFVQRELVETGILEPLPRDMPPEVGVLFAVRSKALPARADRQASSQEED